MNMIVNLVVQWLLARLAEPSTWASIGGLLLTYHFISGSGLPAVSQGLDMIGAGLAQVLGVILSEKSSVVHVASNAGGATPAAPSMVAATGN